MISPEQIAAILAVCEKATPGPLSKHYGKHGGGICKRWRNGSDIACIRFIAGIQNHGEEQQSSDAEFFIAAADPETGLKALALEVARLQERETPMPILSYPCTCGGYVNRNSNYCPNCGRRLEWK